MRPPYLNLSSDAQARAALSTLSILQSTKAGLLDQLRHLHNVPPSQTASSKKQTGIFETRADRSHDHAARIVESVVDYNSRLFAILVSLMEGMLAEQMIEIEARACVRRANEWRRKRWEWFACFLVFAGGVLYLANWS